MFVVARAPQIVSGLPRFEMLRRYVHANCFVCRCMEVLQRFVLSWDIWNLVFVHFVGIGWLGFPVPCCFLTAGELHVFARTAIALSGETPKTAGRCGERHHHLTIWQHQSWQHHGHSTTSCSILWAFGLDSRRCTPTHHGVGSTSARISSCSGLVGAICVQWKSV